MTSDDSADRLHAIIRAFLATEEGAQLVADAWSRAMGRAFYTDPANMTPIRLEEPDRPSEPQTS